MNGRQTTTIICVIILSIAAMAITGMVTSSYEKVKMAEKGFGYQQPIAIGARWVSKNSESIVIPNN